jgi:uncharacterized ferritin-like protein (DUF455 family)
MRDPTDMRAALLAFERAVLVATADRIVRAPRLPVKMFLCRWVWGAACRVRHLRAALPEPLRDAASAATPGARTRRLLRAWQAVASEEAFLVALRDVVAPAALRAYTTLVAADAAPAAGLRRAIRRYRTLIATSWRRRPEAAPVAHELEELHDAAAGFALEVSAPSASASTARTASALTDPAREQVIRALRRGEAREEVWFVADAHDHRRYLHQLIAFEISTFEACSRHIAEFASMPWRFHFDVAGQIRDELRHLEMWLERLPHAGGRLGEWPLSAYEYAVCAGHDLPARIGLLERLVESSALDALDLHRCLWETRDDRVMTAYLAQVQLDEIGHVRLGNRWLRRLCTEDAEIARLVTRAESLARERALAAARTLEAAGLVPPGNVELVRRKFDDPLALAVDCTARARAGFTAAEITQELERRRHAAQEVSE